jgi:hypothetical protein
VSCASADACVAVGSYVSHDPKADGTTALAESWNGGHWSVDTVPLPADAAPGTDFGSQLSGVACTSATACVAVGDYANAADHSLPLVEQWDGRAWTVASAPGLNGTLEAVSCSSSTSCMVLVTTYNRNGGTGTVVESWDAHVWTHVLSLTGSTLSGISCTAVENCVAVGSVTSTNGTTDPARMLALAWDGTHWTNENTPTTTGAALSAVSCVSPTSCTAVGSIQDQTPIVESWDGTQWTPQSTPTLPGRGGWLSGVSCVSPTNCTAVGTLDTAQPEPGPGLVEQHT